MRTTLTLTLTLTLLLLNIILHSTYSAKSHENEKVTATTVRRVETLDYWDEDTLASALGLELNSDPNSEKMFEPKDKAEDTYLGHDAVVLFYAQWCQNCHAMAPMYQRVSEVMKAGTKSSNFVMALFDCEKSVESSQLCQMAGITHYPSILYIGSGPYHDTDLISRVILGKDRAAGPAGHAPLERTVKFQGDWRYGEVIRDWIYAMKGLSSWHKLTNNGLLKWIRHGISGKKHGISDTNSLPVGVVSASSSSGDLAMTRALKKVKDETEVYKNENEILAKSAFHADVVMDAILFLNETDDSYSALYTSNGWENGMQDTLSDDGILRSCTMDLSVDYCSRVARHIPPEKLDGVSMWEIDTIIYDLLGEVDSFCSKIDMCARDDFTKEECRPKSCPFSNKEACAYIATCLNNEVQKAYKDVLAEQENLGSNDKDTNSAGKGWGVA